MIIRGKDKGESGLIKRVIRSQNRVIVEGKNLVSIIVCRAVHSSFLGFSSQLLLRIRCYCLVSWEYQFAYL